MVWFAKIVVNGRGPALTASFMAIPAESNTVAIVLRCSAVATIGEREPLATVKSDRWILSYSSDWAVDYAQIPIPNLEMGTKTVRRAGTSGK